VLEFFGPLESPLQDLTTVDGASIWAGDGVHLTSNATRVAAMKMMAYVIGGETAEPANKRARRPSPCRRRSGCPDSYQTINASTHTREVSSAGGEAASSKGEARNRRPGWPRPGAEAGAGPEAADPAAGAAGEVEQESAKHKLKKVNHLENEKIKSARVQADH
jgi:hypothetical protein